MTSTEPDNLVLQLLRDMRADMADMRTDIARLDAKINTKIDEAKAELRSDIRNVAFDLIATRKELGEQIVGLRRAVVEYHSAVIGHGVLISELEGRVRRIEQHLNLLPFPEPGAH